MAMVGCNWNTRDEPVSMEITHNILDNCDRGLTTDHQPRARHDMSIVMAHVAKVNSSTIIVFCTVNKLLILTSFVVILNNLYCFKLNLTLDLA